MKTREEIPFNMEWKSRIKNKKVKDIKKTK